jgi:hypothetical protein
MDEYKYKTNLEFGIAMNVVMVLMMMKIDA